MCVFFANGHFYIESVCRAALSMSETYALSHKIRKNMHREEEAREKKTKIDKNSTDQKKQHRCWPSNFFQHSKRISVLFCIRCLCVIIFFFRVHFILRFFCFRCFFCCFGAPTIKNCMLAMYRLSLALNTFTFHSRYDPHVKRSPNERVCRRDLSIPFVFLRINTLKMIMRSSPVQMIIYFLFFHFT